MARALPPLNALPAFEAAARLGSFTAAAAELYVTPGAISRQIQSLESDLGCPVFDRIGRRVRLTEAGRLYLAAVQTAFDGLTAATARLRASAGGRRLTIDALPTFTMRWLLPRLTLFQLRHPAVELRLVTSDRPLSASGADFDIGVRREPIDLPGMTAQPFLAEHELPVCHPRLLDRHRIETPADLARLTLLSADTRPGAWARWFAAAGLPRPPDGPRQQFDHFYLTLQAAMDGLGVALGPLPLIADDLADGRLVAPLPGPVLYARHYCWVVPMARRDDPLIADFCAWLTAAGNVEAAG